MQHLNIFVLFDGLQKGMLSMEREFFFCFQLLSFYITCFCAKLLVVCFFMLRERMLPLKVTLLASEGVLRRRSHG